MGRGSIPKYLGSTTLISFRERNVNMFVLFLPFFSLYSFLIFCFIRFQGLGTGIKLVAVAAAGVYGLQQSMFTVDGGHREDKNYVYKGETYSTCVVEFWFGSIFVALVSLDYHSGGQLFFQPVSPDFVPYLIR